MKTELTHEGNELGRELEHMHDCEHEFPQLPYVASELLALSECTEQKRTDASTGIV